MDRHFIFTARTVAAALLATLVLSLVLPPARAQDQDANQQLADLVSEIAVLSKRVCGVPVPTDANAKKLYDERKQTLADDANALIALLEQQKPKGSGVLDKALTDQIGGWEKSLTADSKDPKSCPLVPDDLQKLVNGAGNGTAPAAAAENGSNSGGAQQVTVSPSTVTFDTAQIIGTRSDPVLVTITNSSTKDLDMFVWYGTRLANFWITEDTCNGSTPAQGHCTFKVAFAPSEMPAPGRRGIIENLRVVPSKEWRVFDKVRIAYRELTEAQAEVERASAKVRENRKALTSTAEATQFCDGAQGAGTEACADLKNANGKLKTIQQYNKTTEADYNKAANDLRDKTLAVIPLSGTPNHWKYPLTRAVVGVDLSAVSSQTVKQAYFVEFNLLAPFKLPGMKSDKDALENRLWFWLNPRITSLPKAADFSSLSTISSSGSFFTNFSNMGTVSDIAQGFDVNGGVEVALVKPRDGIPWWGEYVNTQARLGISLIGGGGIATPFSVDKTDVVSQVNQGICDAFKAGAGSTVSSGSGLVCTFPTGSNNPVVVAPNPSGATTPATVQDQFIDFFTPERSRFFRRYYGGFRLKTYFFSPDVRGECSKRPRDQCDAPYDIFPGIIDVTVGQDEAVTAGHLKNFLLRVEGVYPLPFYPGLHVFGSIYSTFNSNHADFPLNSFTINQPASGASNDLNTFRFGTPPLNRDYFRVGIGIDLIQLFKNNKGGQPTTTTSTPSSQGSSSGGSSAKPQGASGGGSGNP